MKLSVSCLALLWPLFGQSAVDSKRPAVQDDVVYESFFRTVKALKILSDKPKGTVLNEQAVAVKIPKLQDVIGMKDSEVNSLNFIAISCVAKLDSLLNHASILHSRIDRIESGEDSPAKAEVSGSPDHDRSRLVLDSVKQLKTSLGDKRFQLLDDFVRSDRIEKDLSPLIDAPTKP